MPITLRIAYLDNEPRTYLIEENIIHLGRYGGVAGENQIDLNPDMKVSRKHASITRMGDTYWVVDLGSSHGTYIGDKLLEPQKRHAVAGGTFIKVGTGTQIEIVDDTMDLDSEVKPTAIMKPIPISLDDKTIKKQISADAVPSSHLKDTQESEGGELLTVAHTHLDAIHNLSAELSTATETEALFTTLITNLQKLIQKTTHCGVLVLNEAGQLPGEATVCLPAGSQDSFSRKLAQKALDERSAFIWEDAEDLTKSIIINDISAAMYAPLVAGTRIFGIAYVINNMQPNAFQNNDLKLMQTLTNQTAFFLQSLITQEKLRVESVSTAQLGQHFAPEQVKAFIAENNLLSEGDAIENCVVFAMRLHGIGKIHPEDALLIVEEITARFKTLLFVHSGRIIANYGDQLLALFVDDAQAAVEVAQTIRIAIQDDFGDLPQVSIALETGKVSHGMLTTGDYVVVGSCVQNASRLCLLATPGKILLSETVREQVNLPDSAAAISFEQMTAISI